METGACFNEHPGDLFVQVVATSQLDTTVVKAAPMPVPRIGSSNRVKIQTLCAHEKSTSRRLGSISAMTVCSLVCSRRTAESGKSSLD
jgi:hypothetical protein